MSTDTTIEWATKTWSPLLGCDKATKGCDGCYAIRTVHRLASNPNPKVGPLYEGLTARDETTGVLDWTGKVRTIPERLTDPLSWRKPQRVFVNSQSDLFHADVPVDFIAEVFAVMALSPRHIFQILTKRHARMRSVLSSEAFAVQVDKTAERLWHGPGWHHATATNWPGWPLPNVWIGVSVEDQKTADMRIPMLLQTPAAVRWISAEPLLGSIDLNLIDYYDPDAINPVTGRKMCGGCSGVVGIAHEPTCGVEPGKWHGLSWVVAGGESGPGARPMHPDWVRGLRDQCQDAGVPFLFKQWGGWAPVEPDVWQNRRETDHDVRADGYHWPISEPHGAEDGTEVVMRKVGKKAAGRLLDGREWNEYPAEVSA